MNLSERLEAFMDECVYPAEEVFREQVSAAQDRWATPPGTVAFTLFNTWF